jgi:broad specificity phosphatase PhoE
MAMPTRVMIIRHGEKPLVKGQVPFGLTTDGQEDWDSLTVRGWQRAGALAGLFKPSRGPLQDPNLAVPDLIYASNPVTTGSGLADSNGDDDEGSKSKRPLQTITPLAAKLAIPPTRNFAKGDEKLLAEDILTQSGTVLVSWQHQKIHKIVEHLTRVGGIRKPIPQVWPPDRFDIVWVFTPASSSAEPWDFVQVPQRLLDGDRDSTI